NLPACARTGMMYLSDGVISDTLPGSPADQAGIRIGDRLLSVNGDLLGTRRSIREISPFSGLPGTRVKVEVQTGSQPPRTCTITLRDLIQ
ncbi:MAG: PDZ domain-containing protein, partial [Verrucomicrobia bacterium]|nr:PDZ domain-containing protein [Verrucomicrobiota bacterium]